MDDDRHATRQQQRAGEPPGDEARLRFLVAVGEALASSLDYQTTLNGIARIAVPFLADLCVIDVVDADAIRPIAVAHIDPVSEERVRDMRRRFPLVVTSTAPVGLVMRTGESLLYPVIPDAFQQDVAQVDEHYSILRSLHYRSGMVVPIRAHGATIGTIMLISTSDDRHYDAGDLQLAEEFADRAANAVDHARLFSAEQQARQLAESAVKRVEQLLAVTEAFSSAMTPAEVAHAVADQTVGVLGADTSGVFLLNATEDQLELITASGIPDDEIGPWRLISLDVPMPSTDVVRSGQPIWLSTHAERLARYPMFATSPVAGAGASAAIPLIVNTRITGVLGISFSEERVLNEAERTFAVVLARQCAQALERARLFEAEQEARAIAEAAVRAREEFLSIAAHELKTPLTSVKGFSQMLLRRLGSPSADLERSLSLAMTLNSQVLRLEELVADLLDVTRIEQGRLALRATNADLTEIAERVMEQFESAHEQSPRHTLTLDAPAPVIGYWDVGRIEQVLVNLISNALKYSAAGGDIHVRVVRVDDSAIVTVNDQGIGISADDQPTLFEPFMRTAEADRTVSGTGLGLYISSRIVGAHGGSISVTSEIGVGSTFTITLPLGVDC